MNITKFRVLAVVVLAMIQGCGKSVYTIDVSGGEQLVLTAMSENAVRVQYVKESLREMPEWIYEGERDNNLKFKVEKEDGSVNLSLPEISVSYENGLLTFMDAGGKVILKENAHSLALSEVQGEPTYIAELKVDSPADEHLYGLGQFQDGYLDVRGLSRRLTQVNTQISIPMVISSRGYALVWNNYGMMDFNPADSYVTFMRADEVGEERVVDITTAEGGAKEVRRSNEFISELELPVGGRYALLLDVGQKMARTHHLAVDGRTVMDIKNLWLPPTSSAIVELPAGRHQLLASLERDDNPVLYYKLIDDETTYRSPVADAVDFTVLAGSAEETIGTYRKLCGPTPMLPDWAMGYVHCRERYHSSAEIIENAKRFREEGLPMDVIVQDWQYWGKYGWNAMQFDEEFYPDPKALTDELHDMNVKMMLSVWSKIDENSELGKEMKAAGYYIDNTTWIDFFNPEAAAAYWRNFSEKLMPTGIDSWWQDATEPENDDLAGRRVNNNTIPGEVFRNTYPLLVAKTVYEGNREYSPDRRAMILTRSGFPGVNRYASVLWSGDVGNDWETLRRQITGGLNIMAAGVPWWTYDAGGFFRPWDQYTNKDYIEKMLRWVQLSVFLPVMRVHGYMSDTEFWNYGPEVTENARKSLELRYRLFPYIYSGAADVALRNSVIMRPLVMDFADDARALDQKYEYMFGKNLLVAPVVEGGISEMDVYLPGTEGGWYGLYDSKPYGNGDVTVAVDDETVPVFVKAGSIIPMADIVRPDGKVAQSVEELRGGPMEIRVYTGADGRFELYEDEGDNYNYEKGLYSRITFEWDDGESALKISGRKGRFEGPEDRVFSLIKVSSAGEETVTNLKYDGASMKIEL